MNLKPSFTCQVAKLFLVRDDGQLLFWKDPDYNTRLPEPNHVAIPGDLVDFACGSAHHLALTVDGKVYAWGGNRNSQLGLPYSGEVREPRVLEIPTSEKIISVYAHGSASYALTERGRLWVWGDNSSSQCGFNSESRSPVTEPTLFPGLDSDPIVDFAASFIHAIALTRDGTVLTWGGNSGGRLGIEREKKTSQGRGFYIPIRLTFFKDAARVYAGSGTSLVLTKSGALYIWGWNDYGILGKGPSDSNSTHVPHMVFKSGVKEVAPGWAHTLVLLDDGSIWSWGNNTSGQAGVEGQAVVHEPHKLNLLGLEGKISGIIGGDNFSALITDFGDFCIFGFNAHPNGIFGRYTEFKVKVPRSSGILWHLLFSSLFLGYRDQNSIFSLLPVEVIFHFVQVMK
jgi:hypothetical protein